MTIFANAMRMANSIGISPSEFWALSLKEWRALVSNNEGLKRADFQELEKLFGENNE